MTRSSSSSTGITRHLSNAVQGWDTPHPTRSPGSIAMSGPHPAIGVLVVQPFDDQRARDVDVVRRSRAAIVKGTGQVLVERHVPPPEVEDREVRLGS